MSPEPPVVDPADEERALAVREGRSHQGKILVAGSLGGMLPLGSLYKPNQANEVPQSDFLTAGGVLGLDAGFAVASGTVIGLWGQYAIFGASKCESDLGFQADCGPNDMWAIGPLLRQHFNVGGGTDFWAGVGFGYRSLTVRRTINAAPAGFDTGEEAFTLSGIDWLHLQFGLDWSLSDNWLIGPVLGMDGGSYTSLNYTTADGTDVEIDGSNAAHYYISLAIRITFASQSLTVTGGN